MHIVLVFLGFAFIIQALLLLRFTVNQSSRYFISHRILLGDLINVYDELKVTHPSMISYFDYAPSWLPPLTRFRDDIENKVIEMHFKCVHDHDDDFPYAHYISKIFRAYIAEVGEVSPICWFMLALLAFVNWIRSYFLPNVFFSTNLCKEEVEVSYDDDYVVHRRLGGDAVDDTIDDLVDDSTVVHHNHFMCFKFFFRYSLFVVLLLMAFLLALHIFACKYYDLILKDALAANAPHLGNSKSINRSAYITFLQETHVRQSSAEKSMLHEKNIQKINLCPKVGRP